MSLLTGPSRRQVTLVSRGSVLYLPEAISQVGLNTTQVSGASFHSPHPSAMLAQDSPHTGQATLHSLKGEFFLLFTEILGFQERLL